MEKGKNKIRNATERNLVYFFGQDNSIFIALKSLSLETKKFQVLQKKFEKELSFKDKYLILDDSCKNFDKNLKYLQDNGFKNYLVTVKNENIDITKDKNQNSFYKPLKIFELYEILSNKFFSDKINNKWFLDKSTMRLCKNKNKFIALTEKEYNFIHFLINQTDNTASKNILLKRIWNISFDDSHDIIETRVIETMVSRIRKKFSAISPCPNIVKVKEGYKIVL